MKRTILVLSVVLALSAATYATPMDSGPGGYFYWNISNATTGTTMEVWRQQFDANWNAVGSAVVDCLTQTTSYATGMASYAYAYRNVEVLDPRASGGTGSLVLALHTDDCTTRYYWYEDMMEIWKVSNPTGTPTNSLLSGGRLVSSGQWDTRDLGSVLPAPANWVPGTTSNGVSLVTSRNNLRMSYGVGSYYLHNASGSTLDCTSASEGFRLWSSADFPDDYWSADAVKDQEFGPDGALYRLIKTSNTINRCWPKNAAMDCSTATVFYNNDCATFVNPGYNGIAVGPGNLGKTLKSGTASASPIVYATGYDSSAKSCIFAFQDVNNDNVITVGTDNIREVWQDEQNGITIGLSWANIFLMQDIEFVAGPAGHDFLLFKQSYGTGACVLELADNGLAAVNDGVIIASGMRSDSYFLAGFEIDADPSAAVPEPATMMLLATGALGGLGRLRRRRIP